LDYRRLVQISDFHGNKLSWYPVPWNLTRQFYIRRLRIYRRFSVPKIINIGKDLSEIFEKITSVRFFLRHSVLLLLLVLLLLGSSNAICESNYALFYGMYPADAVTCGHPSVLNVCRKDSNVFCIHERLMCDGNSDCSDGIDEDERICQGADGQLLLTCRDVFMIYKMGFQMMYVREMLRGVWSNKFQFQ